MSLYNRILVPVDLAHRERLDKALQTAADLAKLYGASICYVGVTASAPGAAAHTPREFTERLAEFGRERGEHDDVAVTTRALVVQDPAVDLDEALEQAVHETGSDLVVMASHVPGFAEHVSASNAGYLAAHSEVSVFVVR